MPPPTPDVATLLSSFEVYRQQASQVIVLARSVPSKDGNADSLIPPIDDLEKASAAAYDNTQDEDQQVAEIRKNIAALIERTDALRVAVRGFYSSVWTLIDPNPYEMMKQAWLENIVKKKKIMKYSLVESINQQTISVSGPCLKGLRLLLAEKYPRFRSSIAWQRSGAACDGMVVVFQYGENDNLRSIQPYGGQSVPAPANVNQLMEKFSRPHGKHLLVDQSAYLVVAMRKALVGAQERLAGWRGRPKNSQEAVPMWVAILTF